MEWTGVDRTVSRLMGRANHILVLSQWSRMHPRWFIASTFSRTSLPPAPFPAPHSFPQIWASNFTTLLFSSKKVRIAYSYLAFTPTCCNNLFYSHEDLNTLPSSNGSKSSGPVHQKKLIHLRLQLHSKIWLHKCILHEKSQVDQSVDDI